MSALVRVCPACQTANDAAALRCDCGALLAGVDLTAPVSLQATVEALHDSSAASASTVCSHADCAQLNPVDAKRCVYCDRPLATAATFAFVWPWGERMPAPAELYVGRTTPVEAALAARIDRDFDNVSRIHAVLHCEGDRLTVEDLASRNGTFVDDVRIASGTPVRIFPGATVRFAADLVMRVEAADED